MALVFGRTVHVSLCNSLAHFGLAAFNWLWEALVIPPVLCLPTLDLPFILHTDASETYVGAVLE